MRVNVSIYNSVKVMARDGSLVYGTCFIPDDPSSPILIRIAAGTWLEDEQALSHFSTSVCSILAHELTHFFQSVHGQEPPTQRGMEWQATWYANRLTEQYLYDTQQ